MNEQSLCQRLRGRGGKSVQGVRKKKGSKRGGIGLKQACLQAELVWLGLKSAFWLFQYVFLHVLPTGEELQPSASGWSSAEQL